MKQLRRLAVLVVPVVVAVIGLASGANAASAKNGASSVGNSRAAALAEFESFVTHLEASSASLCTCTNLIINAPNNSSNISSIRLGVIRVRRSDYSYRLGNYDELLSSANNTYNQFGWRTTAGWYTGPGYCTQQWRSDDGGHTWIHQLPDLGPGQHYIGPNTWYWVEPYQADTLIYCPTII